MHLGIVTAVTGLILVFIVWFMSAFFHSLYKILLLLIFGLENCIFFKIKSRVSHFWMMPCLFLWKKKKKRSSMKREMVPPFTALHPTSLYMHKYKPSPCLWLAVGMFKVWGAGFTNIVLFLVYRGLFQVRNHIGSHTLKLFLHDHF